VTLVGGLETTLTQRRDFTAAEHAAVSRRRAMLNKVPEVTLYFWIIKILCTTVGETAADFLDGNLGLGLTNTTFVMSALLVVSLGFQFRLKRYVPGVYWLAVVLISVVGTLITDNLTDGLGVSLVLSTIGFGIALALTFAAWYASERTLSIHTIVTTRREAFYWLTVLFTFALGTAAGDLTAERLAIGYWQSAVIFAALIAVVYISHWRFAANAILAFWIAYILTRPLGASIGDFLSQPVEETGLGLGTILTSVIFLTAILSLVVYLTISKRDLIAVSAAEAQLDGTPPGPNGLPAVSGSKILVVANKMEATKALVDAVRERAAAAPARFFVLIPNPDNLPFDRNSTDTADGEQVLERMLPLLKHQSGAEIEGGVANSPNAYDDIVAALDSGEYREIILETPPTHVSHWLHVDLSQRIAQLGYPLTMVTATA
jgi:uncharacterized membrane-anchored protein